MRFDREQIAHFYNAGIGHGTFAFRTAFEAVQHNKLRASLTSLGILFGVASVIAMLAIGKGAEQEILEQMRLLGSNNVMITPLVAQKEEQAKDDQPEKQVKKFSPGLTYEDARAIARVIPDVETTSAEIVVNTSITREGRRRSGKVLGVDTTYFRLTNLELQRGSWFTPFQVEHGLPVCIIGYGVRTRFFTTQEAIGHPIKVGDTWLTVVGVLGDRHISTETVSRLGIRDPSMDVYVPVHTMLLRYRNRAELTQRDIEQASSSEGSDDNNNQQPVSDEQKKERTNLNQLDRIIVRVTDSKMVPSVADVARRMLTRRHNAVIDFEITVPELLLKQEQRTKTIFNVVLGAIASISLIVGGIGIMNIMLASVLERIREIGVRRAMGATQKEILFQFLCEAMLISTAGGVAGILLGVALSFGIERAASVHTLVSYPSIVIAFGVSFAVGIVFGIVPAYRAAHQDPVTCLRYE
ncbi:MAG: ABC transporter permease [Gemmatimonadota bacterium]